jgi:hypothetical protein
MANDEKVTSHDLKQKQPTECLNKTIWMETEEQGKTA